MLSCKPACQTYARHTLPWILPSVWRGLGNQNTGATGRFGALEKRTPLQTLTATPCYTLLCALSIEAKSGKLGLLLSTLPSNLQQKTRTFRHVTTCEA